MKQLYEFNVVNDNIELTPNQKIALKNSLEEVLPSVYVDCYITRKYDIEIDKDDLREILKQVTKTILNKDYQQAYDDNSEAYLFLRRICSFFQINFIKKEI